MLATKEIKSIIEAKCKPSELDILNKFVMLLDNYKINYTLISGVPHFAVSNLAKSKGLSNVDFSKNYFDEDKRCILEGVFKKIEGEDLVKFKKAWIKDNNFQFNKANSLWICDFVGAYHYLTIGNSQRAKDFKSLGAKSIEVNVSNIISLEEKREEKLINYQTEEEIQNAICALSSYTNRHFKREQIVVNTFSDQSVRTRRFDLIEIKGKEIKIYELKSNILTSEHIKEVIGEKGYIELAKLKYPKKNIKFYFIAPKISQSAERLLKQMIKVEYLSLDYLVNELIVDIKNEFSSFNSEWYLYKNILPKFTNVLPISL